MSITWLSSLQYKTSLYSQHSVTKVILRLPFQLRKEFYKHIKDVSLTDGSLNLIVFESWLDSQLNVSFNLLV